MAELADIQRRHINLMRQSVALLDHILQAVTQTQASSYRDGEDGWTVLEVLGHLLDFDEIFRERARQIVEEDYPELVAVDHDMLVIERRYNQQILDEIYSRLEESRAQTIAFFEALDDATWERAGVHPERGHFTLTDAVIQVGLHEVGHIEQITRILTQIS